MQLLSTFLASALLVAANQQQHVITVTNYLPFEQDRCYKYFAPGGVNALPGEACLPGACCVGIKGLGVKTDDDGGVVQETVASSYTKSKPGNTNTSLNTNNPIKTIKSPGTDEIIGSYRSSITAKTTTHGSITRTIVEFFTNIRTITEEITITTIETLPEVSRETDIVTTASPETITTTVPETLTETTDVTIFTTTTDIITTTSLTITQETSTTTITTVESDENLIPPPPDLTEDRIIPSSCPTPTCAKGFQYTLYDNPFRQDFSSTYETFDPAYFKKTKPVYDATLNTAIFITDDNVDGKGFNPLFRNAAAGYRGYLFACQAGRYLFNSPYSDDITIMWFGSKAHDGYTRDNADIIQFYYGDNNPRDIYRDLAVGTYYPIRVLWGNTGGASDLSLRIYAPDGSELSGADQWGEYYVTTEACDGSYKPWVPWGSEP